MSRRVRKINFSRFAVSFSSWGRICSRAISRKAQQDFATLSHNLPSGQASSNSASAPGASASTGGVALALKALGQDLQSGNLSGAQQDFSAIQQAVQQQESAGGGHGHHRHHHVTEQQSGSDPISQAFGALGQALQAGNLTSAQTAYASIQQDLQGSLPSAFTDSGTGASPSSTSSSSISVSA
jgi:hypothetical protein